ncbi:hypothetical protein TUM12370_34150 [Salmonella enterica subsp. enterica serovar Choleraesuis]|nr:hypothetical protein TUM12370_34150 [Salmonella enterica subsp. enterica serovar Choleraesuis]
MDLFTQYSALTARPHCGAAAGVFLLQQPLFTAPHMRGFFLPKAWTNTPTGERNG